MVLPDDVGARDEHRSCSLGAAIFRDAAVRGRCDAAGVLRVDWGLFLLPGRGVVFRVFAYGQCRG